MMDRENTDTDLKPDQANDPIDPVEAELQISKEELQRRMERNNRIMITLLLVGIGITIVLYFYFFMFRSTLGLGL